MCTVRYGTSTRRCFGQGLGFQDSRKDVSATADDDGELMELTLDFITKRKKQSPKSRAF